MASTTLSAKKGSSPARMKWEDGERGLPRETGARPEFQKRRWGFPQVFSPSEPVRRDMPARARRRVAEGGSPKDRLYCAENLPKWSKPYRVAIVVTLSFSAGASSRSRAAARRIRRR